MRQMIKFYLVFSVAFFFSAYIGSVFSMPLPIPPDAATAGITNIEADGYITTGKKNGWYSGGSNAPMGNGTLSTDIPDLEDIGMGGTGSGTLAIPGYGGAYSGLTYTYTTNAVPACGGSFFIIDASTIGTATPSIGASGQNVGGANPYYSLASCPNQPAYTSGVGGTQLVFDGTTNVSFYNAASVFTSYLINTRFKITATGAGNWFLSGTKYYLIIPSNTTFTINVLVETNGGSGWTNGLMSNNTEQNGCPYATCNTLGVLGGGDYVGLNYMFHSQHSGNDSYIFQTQWGRIYNAFNPTFEKDVTPPSTPNVFSTSWSGDHYVCSDFLTTVPNNSTDPAIGSGGVYYQLGMSADNSSGFASWVNGGTQYAPGATVTVSGADLPTVNTYRYYMWFAFDACGNMSAAGTQDYVRMAPNASIASVTGVTTLCIGGITTYNANAVVLGGAGVGAWSSSNIAIATVSAGGLVTAVSAGTCDIIYTITGGCGGNPSAQQTVTVNPDASIASVTGSSAVCLGASTTFTANSVVLGGGTGGWSSTNPAVATVSAGGVVTAVSTGSCDIIYTISGGCNGTPSAQQTISINPLPAAFTGSNQTICNGQSVTLGTTAVGGNTYNWVPSTGLSLATASDPTASPSSTTLYSLTETITATGCQQTNSVTVNVNPLPAATVGPNQTICDLQCIQIGGAPVAGNTYAWVPPAFLDDSSISNPSANPPNTIVYTLTETVTATGCTRSDSVTIFVNPVPVVTFSGLAPFYCIDAAPVTLSGSPVMGTFSGPGISGNTFDPASAGVGGPYDISYVYIDGNGCSDTSTQATTINNLPVVSFSGLSGPYCSNITSPVSLTLSPPGGILSGPGISGSDFYPSLANVGNNIINYSYTDGNACFNSYTDSVTVVGVPYTSFSGLDTSYCIDDSNPVSLTGTPGGGTFTGNGISGNIFTPSSAGIGNQTITYTYTDGNGCINSQNQSATVHALPAITFSGLDTSLCVNGSDVSLTGFPAGGSFSGTGISGNTFSPSAAGVGTFAIMYSYTDGSGCSNDTSISTNVYDAPVVSFSGLLSGYCNGSLPVALTGTPSGGSFSGTGISGNSFYPSIAGVGTHTITYTYSDGYNCINSQSQNVDVYALPVVSFSGLSGPYCANGTSVTLAGNPSGGVFSGNGISGNDFDPVIAGAGTHTINYYYSDGNGCSDSSFQDVVVNPAPVVDFSGLDTAYCENNPSVSLFGLPAGGAFSGNGVSGNNFDPSTSGTGMQNISYTYTDGNGCTNNIVKNTIVNSAPVASITPGGPIVFCQGGSVSLTASPGVSYAWSTGAILPAITVSSSGNYSVTITNGSNCSSDASISVNANSNPSLMITSVSDASCNGGNNGSATVNASGGAFPYSYLWDNNAGNQTAPVATGLNAGTYVVTVTDLNNCSSSISVTINNPSGLSAVTNSANTCIGGSLGTASVFASGGTSPYSYLWDNSAGNQTSSTATGLSSGTFTVTVTDANSCTFLVTASVDSSTAVFIATVSTPTCIGGSTGTATITPLGGTIPYSILWDSNASNQTSATATGLNSGNFSVTVSDSNSCTATSTVNVGSVPGVNLSSSSNSGCAGGNSGTVTVIASGGTSPYSYQWDAGTGNQTSSTATGLVSGSYSVTVSDMNGCSSNTMASVVAAATLNSAVSSTNVLCNGGATGTATVTAGGGTSPYSYLWSDGQNTSSVSNLSSGNYFVVVTDSNACTDTSYFVINQPTPVVLSTSSTMASCGAANGTASISAVGGTVPYSFLWDSNTGNQTSTTATGLPAGVYSVTVTDGNACTGSTVVIVNGTSSFSIETAATNVMCNGGNDGTAIVVANGGTTPYTYLWSDGQTTSSATGLAMGSYSVTVTNADGCSAADTISVTQPPPIISGISNDTTICSGDSIILTATGGVDYLWTTGQNTASINVAPSASTVFSVGVFDGISCMVSESVDITVIPLVNAVISGEESVCMGKTITLTAGDGTDYLWNTGDTTGSIDVSPLQSSVFYVTTSNSCFTDTASFSVTVSYINASFSEDTTILIGTEVQLNAGGGVQYLWDPPTNLTCTDCPNPLAGPNVTTTYFVTVTDASGCQASDTIEITVDDSKTIFVPNIFSPNGDGANDVLYVFGKGLVKIKISIFDRWGGKLYEYDGTIPQMGGKGGPEWDGISPEGMPYNTAVFVYYLTVEFYDGEVQHLHGNFTLVR